MQLTMKGSNTKHNDQSSDKRDDSGPRTRRQQQMAAMARMTTITTPSFGLTLLLLLASTFGKNDVPVTMQVGFRTKYGQWLDTD